MRIALRAYSRVESDSSTERIEGESVAMMHVLVRPPSESCSRRVSFESLHTVGVTRATTWGGGRTGTGCAGGGVGGFAPVRDVRAVLHERRYDAAKGEQGLVDLPRLARAAVRGTGAPDALRPRQIHEVQLPDLHKSRHQCTVL